MKTIAFFNNKGGVGKTSLVYHLAWMFADKGIRTLAVDLDPQANLTSMFLGEERSETLWSEGGRPDTAYSAIAPVMSGVGDVAMPRVLGVADNLKLLSGDLELSRYEDGLSENWTQCLLGHAKAFHVTTAFCRMIQLAAGQSDSEVVLVDMGSNLGALNRSVIISVDQVVIPMMPDMFSLRGLYVLGSTLREWRDGWNVRLDTAAKENMSIIQTGKMEPSGYIVMQHGGLFHGQMQSAYQRWLDKMPSIYREAVLGESFKTGVPLPLDDPYNLALLKHYRSLMPMAMEVNKPMFFLKSADGAIGAHQEAVSKCYKDFESLAAKIAANAGIAFPIK